MNGVQKHVVITLGETVTANKFAEEFGLTADKEYIVKGHEGECVKVTNDKGEELCYSLDYFKEFADRYDTD